MAQNLFLIFLIIAGIVISNLWHHFAVYFVNTAGLGAGIALTALLILFAFVLDPP